MNNNSKILESSSKSRNNLAKIKKRDDILYDNKKKSISNNLRKIKQLQSKEKISQQKTNLSRKLGTTTKELTNANYNINVSTVAGKNNKFEDSSEIPVIIEEKIPKSPKIKNHIKNRSFIDIKNLQKVDFPRLSLKLVLEIKQGLISILCQPILMK